MISKGNYFLSKTIGEFEMGEFQIQALIVWNHTLEDSSDKWDRMLELYNKLLSIKLNPIVIINRAYVLYRCGRSDEAIQELNNDIIDKNNYQYNLTLANIYKNININLSKSYFELAIFWQVSQILAKFYLW
ncbi:MAG: hypothetical protein MH321_14870 [Leptospiraceae bacterium]|nr:hypothetical protein [Leptospiraceae bacterium]